MLTGAGDPQVRQVDLAQVHARILAPVEDGEQQAPVDVKPFQLAIVVGDHLGEEPVLADVALQRPAELLGTLGIVDKELGETVTGRVKVAIKTGMRPLPLGIGPGRALRSQVCLGEGANLRVDEERTP